VTKKKNNAVATRRGYQPLGRLTSDQRQRVLDEALVMLEQEKPLFEVAKHFGISKTTLLDALNQEREERWQAIQIAKAQAAADRASDKRRELGQLLEDFQAKEAKGAKTTETSMTYPRIREQLRIAEQDEKSAQWHLERLLRRIYGNSVEVRGTPAVQIDAGLVASISELIDRKVQAVDAEVIEIKHSDGGPRGL